MDEDPDAIAKSDLVKLMDVVGAAIGLYNQLEKEYKFTELRPWADEYEALGNTLRALGVAEVSVDG